MGVWELLIVFCLCVLVSIIRFMFYGSSFKKALVLSLLCTLLFFPLFYFIKTFDISNLMAYLLIGLLIIFLLWLDFKLDKVFPKRQNE
jgi:hypothetical protein